MSHSVLVIAGEISGDMHASKVVKAIKAQNSDIEFWGIGGDLLRAEGVDLIHDVKEMAVMGLAEVLKRYGFFKKVFKQMVQLAEERKPDAVLLVDYPGFNLRFAKQMKKRGIKVLYYVCPQVWAWHRSRIDKVAHLVDHLYVIFPFEVDVFKGKDLRVDFVGHPLIEATREALERPDKPLPWSGGNRVAILPGSRKQEVDRILPVMLEAAEQLKNKQSDLSFLIASPTDEITEEIKALQGPNSQIEIITGNTREVLKQAGAAMVASGTATLETALMDCPMIVVYKTSWLTYQMARRLIRIDHIGMVNIVAGKTICPELIQHEANPQQIIHSVEPLLSDTDERKTMMNEIHRVKELLGVGGAANNTAKLILDELA